jgi:hypothetical protein
VGEVDQHAEPVHLADDLAAELGEAARRRAVGRGVGPGGVLVVGEGEVAHAQSVQGAQRTEGVVDGVATLGSHQAPDPPAVGQGRVQPVGAGHQDQVVGIPLDHQVDRVHLLERRGDRLLPGEGAGDEHRPELSADSAGPEPRQVGVQLRLRAGDVDGGEVVGELAHGPRQVVVTVHHQDRGRVSSGLRHTSILAHPGRR